MPASLAPTHASDLVGLEWFQAINLLPCLHRIGKLERSILTERAGRADDPKEVVPAWLDFEINAGPGVIRGKRVFAGGDVHLYVLPALHRSDSLPVAERDRLPAPVMIHQSEDRDGADVPRRSRTHQKKREENSLFSQEPPAPLRGMLDRTTGKGRVKVSRCIFDCRLSIADWENLDRFSVLGSRLAVSGWLLADQTHCRLSIADLESRSLASLGMTLLREAASFREAVNFCSCFCDGSENRRPKTENR